MMSTRAKTDTYNERLQKFLTQIHTVEQNKRNNLYEIMDMVPFRDLETALMMATLDDRRSYR